MASSVALHPEGVDRNPAFHGLAAEAKDVALHPEGVDRNYTAGVYGWNSDGRPPPGGRG